MLVRESSAKEETVEDEAARIAGMMPAMQAVRERRGDREQQDGTMDGDLIEPENGHRREGAQRVNRERRDSEAQDTTCARQNQTLDQELLQQPRPRRAKRGSDRELAAAAQAARQQQVRDVRTGDRSARTPPLRAR